MTELCPPGFRGLPAHRLIVARELEPLTQSLDVDAITALQDSGLLRPILVRGPYKSQYEAVAGVASFLAQQHNAVICVKRAGDATIDDIAPEEIKLLVEGGEQERQRLDGTIQQWLEQLLIPVVSDIDSIWLFGSRANKRARPPTDPRGPSDWDLMAFGSFDIKIAVAQAAPLARNDVDLFLMSNYPADIPEARQPWRDARLTLHGLEWMELSTDYAEYSGEATHNPLDDQRCRAYRIWPLQTPG